MAGSKGRGGAGPRSVTSRLRLRKATARLPGRPAIAYARGRSRESDVFGVQEWAVCRFDSCSLRNLRCSFVFFVI